MGLDGTLGRRFRALRRERGLTLDEVATATDISRSFLSLFENGKSDITFGRLARLAGFFAIGFDELLPEPRREASVVRREERRRIASSAEHAVGELLTLQGRRLGAMLFTLEPGGAVHEGATLQGELFVLVLRGRVELAPRDREEMTLRAGDGALLRVEGVPCPPFRNVGRGPAEVLFVGAGGGGS